MPIRKYLTGLAILVLGTCLVFMVLGRFDYIDRTLAIAGFLVSLLSLYPTAQSPPPGTGVATARIPRIELSRLIQAGLLGGTLSGVLAALVYLRELAGIPFVARPAASAIVTPIVVYSIGCGILLSTITYLTIRAVFAAAARFHVRNDFVVNEILSGAIGGAVSGMIAGPIGGVIFGTKPLPVISSLETLLVTLPGILCIFFMTLLLIGHKASVSAAVATLIGLVAVFIAAFLAYLIGESTGLVLYAVWNFIDGDAESTAKGGFALGALFGVVYGIGLGTSALAWRLIKVQRA